jgi:hypothetical protein
MTKKVDKRYKRNACRLRPGDVVELTASGRSREGTEWGPTEADLHFVGWADDKTPIIYIEHYDEEGEFFHSDHRLLNGTVQKCRFLNVEMLGAPGDEHGSLDITFIWRGAQQLDVQHHWRHESYGGNIVPMTSKRSLQRKYFKQETG